MRLVTGNAIQREWINSMTWEMVKERENENTLNRGWNFTDKKLIIYHDHLQMKFLRMNLTPFLHNSTIQTIIVFKKSQCQQKRLTFRHTLKKNSCCAFWANYKRWGRLNDTTYRRHVNRVKSRYNSFPAQLIVAEEYSAWFSISRNRSCSVLDAFSNPTSHSIKKRNKQNYKSNLFFLWNPSWMFVEFKKEKIYNIDRYDSSWSPQEGYMRNREKDTYLINNLNRITQLRWNDISDHLQPQITRFNKKKRIMIPSIDPFNLKYQTHEDWYKFGESAEEERTENDGRNQNKCTQKWIIIRSASIVDNVHDLQKWVVDLTRIQCVTTWSSLGHVVTNHRKCNVYLLGRVPSEERIPPVIMWKTQWRDISKEDGKKSDTHRTPFDVKWFFELRNISKGQD